MKLSPTQIKEIAERAEKATKGRWLYRPRKHDDWGLVVSSETGFPVVKAEVGHFIGSAECDEHRRRGTDPCEHNGRFACEARQDIPALLAHIAAQDGEIKALRDLNAKHCAAVESLGDEISKLERERDEAKSQHERERNAHAGTAGSHVRLREDNDGLRARIAQLESLLAVKDGALKSAWAALGDNMGSQSLGGRGIEKGYAQAVMEEIDEALKASAK